VYVPLPDLEARKEMFRLYLDRRPVADDLDFDAFATATEGYIASDIAFIVNDVAMTAAFARKTITNELMLTTIQQTKPSLNAELIKEYQEMRDQQDLIQRRVIVQGL
jgi:transitional endoplasmic reticulum ATPase